MFRDVNAWQIDAPDLVILNDSFCGKLSFPSLTDLLMDHNTIADIGSNSSRGCIHDLMNLKILNISFNYFSFAKIVLHPNVSMLENLIDLDISHQNSIFFLNPLPISIWLYYNLLPKLTTLECLDMSCIMHHSIMMSFIWHIGFSNHLKYLNFLNNFVRVLSIFNVSTKVPIEVFLYIIYYIIYFLYYIFFS